MPDNDIPDVLYYLADPENWTDYGFVVEYGKKKLAHEFIGELIKRWESIQH